MENRHIFPTESIKTIEDRRLHNKRSTECIQLASAYFPQEDEFEDFIPRLESMCKRNTSIRKPYSAFKTALYMAESLHSSRKVTHITDGQTAYNTYLDFRQAYRLEEIESPPALLFSQYDIGNSQIRDFVMHDSSLPFSFIINTQRYLEDGHDHEGFSYTPELDAQWHIPPQFRNKAGTRLLTQIDYEFFFLNTPSIHIIKAIDYKDDGSIHDRLVLKEGYKPDFYEGNIHYDSSQISAPEYS